MECSAGTTPLLFEPCHTTLSSFLESPTFYYSILFGGLEHLEYTHLGGAVVIQHAGHFAELFALFHFRAGGVSPYFTRSRWNIELLGLEMLHICHMNRAFQKSAAKVCCCCWSWGKTNKQHFFSLWCWGRASLELPSLRALFYCCIFAFSDILEIRQISRRWWAVKIIDGTYLSPAGAY